MSELSPDARDLIAQARKDGPELLRPSAEQRARLRERLTPLWAAEEVQQPVAASRWRWKGVTAAVIVGLSALGLFLRPGLPPPAADMAAARPGHAVARQPVVAGCDPSAAAGSDRGCGPLAAAGCDPSAVSGSGRGCSPLAAAAGCDASAAPERGCLPPAAAGCDPNAVPKSERGCAPVAAAVASRSVGVPSGMVASQRKLGATLRRPERARASGAGVDCAKVGASGRNPDCAAVEGASVVSGRVPERRVEYGGDHGHEVVPVPERGQDHERRVGYGGDHGHDFVPVPERGQDHERRVEYGGDHGHDFVPVPERGQDHERDHDHGLDQGRGRGADRRGERDGRLALKDLERTAERVVDTSEDPAPPSLDGELELLGAAQAALQKQRPSRALNLLQEHAFRFPTGSLVEERMAMQALALCALQRRNAAQTVLSNLEARGSQSQLLPRVRKQCGL